MQRKPTSLAALTHNKAARLVKHHTIIQGAAAMQAATLAASQPTIDTSRATRPRVLSPVAFDLLRFALLHPARTFTPTTPFIESMRRQAKARRNALRLAAHRAAVRLVATGLLCRMPCEGAARYQISHTVSALTLAARLLLTRQEER